MLPQLLVRVNTLILKIHVSVGKALIRNQFMICRVKQAMFKKEETIGQIKQQYQAAVRRADHLEGLLELQRKQLVGVSK